MIRLIPALAILLLAATPAMGCTVGAPSPYDGAYIVSCGKNSEYSSMSDSQNHTLEACQSTYRDC